MKLSKYIDHTLLKQDATKDGFIKLCKEAIEYDFKTVCVNPSRIELCKELLNGTDVQVCTVIGFPLGANSCACKVFETLDAIKLGADEIDMVINIGALKDQDYDYIVDEIKQIKKACNDTVLKVIIETCLLTDEEIAKACELCLLAKADFVKTSTGFSTSGANIEVVKIMKATVKDNCFIKAAGGVRSNADLLNMIKCGANRIGTSSGCALIDDKEATVDNY